MPEAGGPADELLQAVLVWRVRLRHVEGHALSQRRGSHTSEGSCFDDMNQDGQRDPTCGTRDFKAGLVLRVACEPGFFANDPSEGTTLVPHALSGLPASPTT